MGPGINYSRVPVGAAEPSGCGCSAIAVASGGSICPHPLVVFILLLFTLSSLLPSYQKPPACDCCCVEDTKHISASKNIFNKFDQKQLVLLGNIPAELKGRAVLHQKWSTCLYKAIVMLKRRNCVLSFCLEKYTQKRRFCPYL